MPRKQPVHLVEMTQGHQGSPLRFDFSFGLFLGMAVFMLCRGWWRRGRRRRLVTVVRSWLGLYPVVQVRAGCRSGIRRVDIQGMTSSADLRPAAQAIQIAFREWKDETRGAKRQAARGRLHRERRRRCPRLCSSPTCRRAPHRSGAGPSRRRRRRRRPAHRPVQRRRAGGRARALLLLLLLRLRLRLLLLLRLLRR